MRKHSLKAETWMNLNESKISSLYFYFRAIYDNDAAPVFHMKKKSL